MTDNLLIGTSSQLYQPQLCTCYVESAFLDIVHIQPTLWWHL